MKRKDHDWIIVCVCLKGCKYSTHKLSFFKCCISFEMDLSTLKLASTKGATKYKFSFSFTQDNVV